MSLLKRLFVFIILVLCVSTAYSSDFRFSYNANFHPPFGGIDKNESSLQSETSTASDRFEVEYFSGKDIGFLLGLGKGVQLAKYIQNQSSERSFSKYQSLYDFYYFRAGFWKRIQTNLRFEPSVTFGQGDFKLKNKTTGEKDSHQTKNFTVEMKLAYELDIKNVPFKTDVFVGLGYYKNFVNGKKFDVGSNSFKDKDFTGDAFFNIGLGIRF